MTTTPIFDQNSWYQIKPQSNNSLSLVAQPGSPGTVEIETANSSDPNQQWQILVRQTSKASFWYAFRAKGTGADLFLDYQRTVILGSANESEPVTPNLSTSGGLIFWYVQSSADESGAFSLSNFGEIYVNFVWSLSLDPRTTPGDPPGLVAVSSFGEPNGTLALNLGSLGRNESFIFSPLGPITDASFSTVPFVNETLETAPTEQQDQPQTVKTLGGFSPTVSQLPHQYLHPHPPPPKYPQQSPPLPSPTPPPSPSKTWTDESFAVIGSCGGAISLIAIYILLYIYLRKRRPRGPEKRCRWHELAADKLFNISGKVELEAKVQPVELPAERCVGELSGESKWMQPWK
ncbi:hypothetical protein G7Y89_g7145 [Cudoniella acicularis]|uniref:Uncharacterized protein n=1 Tax=Cudoniella acicularis TaxID=354080 RepID=A0A8H4W437_9HELO|nr:hypothetical protein G7Y89_g7145 [Cudoniella acicularis]